MERAQRKIRRLNHKKNWRLSSLIAHGAQRILFQRRILARSFCLAVSGFFSLLLGFAGTCIICNTKKKSSPAASIGCGIADQDSLRISDKRGHAMYVNVPLDMARFYFEQRRAELPVTYSQTLYHVRLSRRRLRESRHREQTQEFENNRRQTVEPTVASALSLCRCRNAPFSCTCPTTTRAYVVADLNLLRAYLRWRRNLEKSFAP